MLLPGLSDDIHGKENPKFGLGDALMAYRLRWKRRRLLARAWQKRFEIKAVHTRKIPRDGVLVFSTVRNEAERIEFWLQHYRKLGVTHFLIVDNDSDDETAEILANQHDVSLWRSAASYKSARFGMDWLSRLQTRYGNNRWCLTVDADEILVFPDWGATGLSGLTKQLDDMNAPSFGALMLDLYRKGPVSGARHVPGSDPTKSLPYFDPTGYTWERLDKRHIISIRGGMRQRVFFRNLPDHGPHLHKIPLVKWRKSFVYLSSTHDALPRRLNKAFDARTGLPTGVLLHSKFLNSIVEKSIIEKRRAEHFTHPSRYIDYYDAIIADPDLWFDESIAYNGAEQLERLGLMTRGDWSAC